MAGKSRGLAALSSATLNQQLKQAGFPEIKTESEQVNR
jgi:hypothetical protein